RLAGGCTGVQWPDLAAAGPGAQHEVWRARPGTGRRRSRMAGTTESAPVPKATTPAAAITATRSHCGTPGSMYSEIASTWSRVLTLPPRLAAITPWRITQNRSPVTAISLTRVTAGTPHARQPRQGRDTRAATAN